MIADAVLIAGPTASGKSAAALDMARRENRVIVNADSMQVYRGLSILSAAPSTEEMRQAPHLLYGHVDPADDYSAGTWLRDVKRLQAEGAFAEKPPVFVGGTGLYFRALCGGLSEIPATPPDIREALRSRLVAEGAESLHAELRSLDPEVAAKLVPQDGQRIVRALEVLAATGRSLRYWQNRKGISIIDPLTVRKFLLQPDRRLLAERIGKRFEHMLAQGALEEARRLGALRLLAGMPALKAIGLRELLAFDRGEITLDQASERAKAATRQYAKRQATWFRHQTDATWQRSTEWPRN